MNRVELRKVLVAHDIPPSAYDLDGTWKNDAYILRDDGAGWTIYYHERGIRRPVAFCGTEEEACERLFDQLRELKP